MGSTLDALHQLQVIELQLAAIRRKREAKAREIQTYKRKVNDTKAELEENARKRREHQVTLDALTLDVAAREQSIGKHRQALSKAKTNREYAAILTAMNTEKADNAKLESTSLQLMDTIQSLNDQHAETEAIEAKLVQQVAASEESLRSLDDESKAERERLSCEREACAERIAPAALASFRRVAQHHNGEAMAAIAKLSPKSEDYVCSGCNMKITLEIINNLQTRDEIQICGVCGRILYLKPQGAAWKAG